MAFESAGGFLRSVTRKLKLDGAAVGGVICARVEQLIALNYKGRVWIPKKYTKGVLTIVVRDSAQASSLYTAQMQLLEEIQKLSLPERVRELKIQVLHQR